MASEPILWVRPGYTPPAFKRTGPDGEDIIEKFPATAKPPEDHPLHGQKVRRWEIMIDAAGNEVRVCYSGAAADYQVDHPQYGKAIARRHAKHGWFRKDSCPLVLVQAKVLEPSALSRELRGGTPCEPGTYSATRPCPHAVAETAERKAKNLKREKARAEAFRSEADKLQREALEAQKKQSGDTVDVFKELSANIAKLIGGGQHGNWPMARPDLTAEEYEAVLKLRAQKAAASTSSEPPPDVSTSSDRTSDDELERMLLEADADETSIVSSDTLPMAEPAVEPDPRPEPSNGRKGRRS